MGPRLANWPNDSSRKNKGTPIRAKETKYGIRKAPVKQIVIVKKIVKVFRDFECLRNEHNVYRSYTRIT